MPASNYEYLNKYSQVLVFMCIILPVFLVFSIATAYAANECEDGDLAKCEKEIDKYEDRYESTSKKLSDIKSKQESVTSKIASLSGQLSVTDAEINDISANIADVLSELAKIETILLDKNAALADKFSLRTKIVKTYYQKGVLNDFEVFFANKVPANLNGFQFTSASNAYQKAYANETLKIIDYLNSEISSYEEDKATAQSIKANLENEKANLLALKDNLANQKNQASAEHSELEDQKGDYEKELSSLQSKIDRLSTLQKKIIAEKFGEETGTVGQYDSVSVDVPSAPFKPAFGAFSYGAYTHYNGMSQFGAKGRAQAGHDYKKIIKHYYGNDVKDKDDFPSKVSVEGYGEMDFQKYLYGLAEMPSDWPEDALKAQAIAGRTYAYRFVKKGKAICTTQSCQVFSKSKSDNPPSSWKKAVDDTKDKIIDGDVTAQYSSTAGGYLNDSGWDDDGEWPKDSYERKAGSPWFRWSWFSKGFAMLKDTCGRGYPWMSSEEMADIINAWVVWKASGGNDSKISPITTSCWGGNPYSMSELRDKADKVGKVYKSVSDIDVDIGNNGKTTKVYLKTDRGDLTIDGAEFQTVFNLRAPSYVAIRSRLYDFEVKK
ncbi:MAG: SpoIID/LytB domain-containing protein [Patescibacteria group bacterium]